MISPILDGVYSFRVNASDRLTEEERERIESHRVFQRLLAKKYIALENGLLVAVDDELLGEFRISEHEVDSRIDVENAGLLLFLEEMERRGASSSDGNRWKEFDERYIFPNHIESDGTGGLNETPPFMRTHCPDGRRFHLSPTGQMYDGFVASWNEKAMMANSHLEAIAAYNKKREKRERRKEMFGGFVGRLLSR
jgi:hypothetical protein